MIEGHSLRRHRDLTSRRERQVIVSLLSALGSAIGGIAAGIGGLAGAGAAAGGSALATGLAATGAAAAAAGTGYAIASGERGKRAQAQAMAAQRKLQDAQIAQARSQQRRSQQAMAAATREQPAVGEIMQQAGMEGGPSTTMLTGPMGVNPQQLQLGRSTLLGG